MAKNPLKITQIFFCVLLFIYLFFPSCQISPPKKKKKKKKKKKTDTCFPFKQSQQVVIKSSNKLLFTLSVKIKTSPGKT